MKKGFLITIGSFDGVHRGHQALIDRTVLEAKKRKFRSLALTFGVPPKMVLDPNGGPRILSDAHEKEALLQRMGVGRVVSLNFDRSVASLKPFSFFRSILLEQFGARGLVVGADFRFGKDRSAGALELVHWGLEFEIPVWVIPPVRYQKKVVSSSLIRQLLETDHFKKATGFLGHPYLIGGKVARERGTGRKLGFPTANLQTAPEKILPRGVFVVRGWIEDSKKKTFAGVCNIGVRPTFLKKSEVKVEVHIFNRSGNLLSRTLFIELLHQLREEKKFKNPTELKKAIATDVRRARAYLRQNPA